MLFRSVPEHPTRQVTNRDVPVHGIPVREVPPREVPQSVIGDVNIQAPGGINLESQPLGRAIHISRQSINPRSEEPSEPNTPVDAVVSTRPTSGTVQYGDDGDEDIFGDLDGYINNDNGEEFFADHNDDDSDNGNKYGYSYSGGSTRYRVQNTISEGLGGIHLFLGYEFQVPAEGVP